jgi:protein-tyrosine phosphatase
MNPFDMNPARAEEEPMAQNNDLSISTGKTKMTRPAKKNDAPIGMKTKILFVCMGNICRSPTAHGVFQSLVKASNLQDFVVSDSAGTHDFHVGEPADPRAVSAAAKRGYDLNGSVARKIQLADFSEYDYILAMDWENLALLQRMCPRGLQHKLQLLMRFATEFEAATINDPYHGGPQGFEQALDLVEDACNGLMEVVRRRATMVAAA